MQKLMELRRAHPIGYSAAAALVSIAIILLAGVAVQVVVTVAGIQADYYVQVLDGESGTVYNDVTYKLDHQDI